VCVSVFEIRLFYPEINAVRTSHHILYLYLTEASQMSIFFRSFGGFIYFSQVTFYFQVSVEPHCVPKDPLSVSSESSRI